MSILLFNTTPLVFSDRIRGRHAIVRAIHSPSQFNGGTFSQSSYIATLLDIRGKGSEEIANRLATLSLPENCTAIWIEN